jgi:enamine deaminase RidA (YjgF/YER057c/UK114 family)
MEVSWPRRFLGGPPRPPRNTLATYSQGIKVTHAQTILFLSGQVAYTADGGVACRGDFRGQA